MAKKKSTSTNSVKFVFHKHDDIGSAAAEDDSKFLEECFVDTGDLAYLIDCDNSKTVVVGRTGAGKSALLAELLDKTENSINLSPHSLSLNFLANNNLIGFFEEAGVNLAVFYGLLWKHVLVVELLKKKFNIRNESGQKNYMRNIRNLVYKKDKFKEMAVDYFETWGKKFWLTTEERIKELTKRVEQHLSGSISGSLFDASAGVEAAKKLTTEEKLEVVNRGQKAVSEVQVRELENMLSVLNENIFCDPQAPYFISVDLLDEEWTDDRIRYKLIKSLIDTVRHFQKIRNVKVIIALRQDLLDRVLHSTHDIGFQEEKYESSYLELQWTKKQLTNLVEKRINFLVKRRYSSLPISYKDIFPKKILGRPAFDYIYERTFMRPRDVILFINECINKAVDSEKLSEALILRAEEEYSYKRLQSLATEWVSVFPQLITVLEMFSGFKRQFKVSDVSEELVLDWFTLVSTDMKINPSDQTMNSINNYFTKEGGNFSSVRNFFLRNLFLTGFIGIKTGPRSSTRWSTDTRLSLAPGQVKPSSIVEIHPMFYKALEL